MNKNNSLVTCLLLMSLFAMSLSSQTGCNQATGKAEGNKNDKNQASKVAVIAIHLKPGNLKQQVPLATSVEGYEVVKVMSKIDGYVDTVEANIGDIVENGHTIAKIRSDELGDELKRQDKMVLQVKEDVKSALENINLANAQLVEQKAMLDLRKIVLTRAEKLFKSGAFNQIKVDEATFALTSTTAAISRAKANVAASEAHHQKTVAAVAVAEAAKEKAASMADYRNITAPFDGLIMSRMVDPGSFVRPGSGNNATVLFDIARVDKVRLIVYLPMDQSTNLDGKDTVTINQISGIHGGPISKVGNQKLKISRYARSLNDQSRMMRAEIDVDNMKLFQERNHRLKPGDYGNVTLDLADYTGKLTIPSSLLVVGEHGRKAVWKVNQENKLEKVLVDVVFSKDGKSVIYSKDLKIDDTIIAQNLSALKVGMKINQADIKYEDTSNLK